MIPGFRSITKGEGGSAEPARTIERPKQQGTRSTQRQHVSKGACWDGRFAGVPSCWPWTINSFGDQHSQQGFPSAITRLGKSQHSEVGAEASEVHGHHPLQSNFRVNRVKRKMKSVQKFPLGGNTIEQGLHVYHASKKISCIT